MPPTQDHDLLIRLDENMRSLTGEVKLLRDGTISRINDIERGKLSTDEFRGYKEDVDKSIKALWSVSGEQGRKIDRQSYFVYIGIGIVITLQFIGLVVASAKL